VAIAAWAVFALAGAYTWTLLPIVVAAVVLAFVVRPAPAESFGPIEAALIVGLAIIALQLLPLPGVVRGLLSPHRSEVAGALLLTTDARGPLTLNASATGWALAAGAAMLLVFLSARALFERQQGLRHVCRGIAWVGFILAAGAFLQRALTPSLVYGTWRPVDLPANILPWGPFINRNDFAAWLLMAIPLTIGYVTMRIGSHQTGGRGRVDPSAVLDARMMLLVATNCLMTGAVLASLSRSGIVSMAIAMAAFIALAGGRAGRERAAMVTVGMVALMVAAGTYANLPAVLARMNETLPSGFGGRLVVWAETWPIVRDFAGTGVGVGAFERAMLVYQQSNRLMFFNHAHNEYLQVLAEGGLPLAGAAASAVVAGIGAAARRLREDRSAVYWARAGAVSGLVGIACQSVWDTALRLPANAVLFAILAAIAVHKPARSSDERPMDAARLD
jgi:O-antigen ligase